MGYITFDKSSMVNLSFGLNREVLRTNRAGAYGSSTIIDCNTRKYHGYLVAPQPNVDNDLHVLLSSIDDTIIQHNKEFNLSVHRYSDDKGGCYFPKGHKYISEFHLNPVPSITYSVGGVVLKKERMNTVNDTQCMIRYTLLKAHSKTTLRIRPLLAFRNRHSLSKANFYVNKNYWDVDGGVKFKMYNNYSELFFQINSPFEYVHVPDWYYNFEYEKDKERGYDYLEDLYNPGFFDIPLEVGKSVIVSVATSECDVKTLSRKFNRENSIRVPRDSFFNCLINCAQQFIVNNNGKLKVIAGYQWLGEIPRETFISLPGLTFSQDREDLFRKVLNDMLKDMKDNNFEQYYITSQHASSADESLWFIWALQQYANNYKDKAQEYIRKYWWKYIKQILKIYKKGNDYIYIDKNNLLYQHKKDTPLTWMDAIVDNKCVTQRSGFAVEINALFYNAICFALDIAKAKNDKDFIEDWGNYKNKLGDSIVNNFYNEDKICLCDYFNDDIKDWTIRPNQLIAVALDYTPFNEDIISKVIKNVESELLTPRGIRTLSPRYSNYNPRYEGSHNNRGLAQHNGVAYPWLLMFYIDAYSKLYDKKSTKVKVTQIIRDFEPEMAHGGLGAISEVYNGNPPYEGSGTISQAVNVSALLMLMYNYGIKNLKEKK